MDMPFGIFTVRMDENFTVLAGNGRYYGMIGYTPEQLRDELNNQAARYMCIPTVWRPYAALYKRQSGRERPP